MKLFVSGVSRVGWLSYEEVDGLLMKMRGRDGGNPAALYPSSGTFLAREACDIKAITTNVCIHHRDCDHGLKTGSDVMVLPDGELMMEGGFGAGVYDVNPGSRDFCFTTQMTQFATLEWTARR